MKKISIKSKLESKKRKAIFNEELKTRQFTIDFHNQTVNKNKLSLTFSIAFQTSSKNIEKQCKETWPYLLLHQEYTLDQLKELQKMKRYIKSNLSKSDIQSIHKYFYEQSWLRNIQFSSNITNIELTDFNAKYWTDKELPYLELNGIITMDIEKLLNIYIKKNYIKILKPYKNKLTKQKISFKFIKPLPLILTYRNVIDVKNIILRLFKEYINSKNSNLLKKMTENEMKIKKIHEYKKEIQWKFQDEIELEITDVLKLLKLKAKNNILPMVGGYLLYRNLRNK